MLAGWRRGTRNIRLQLLLSLPVAVGVVGSALLLYRLLAAPLGLDLDAVRERLEYYGLSAANPVGDLGALAGQRAKRGQPSCWVCSD